MQKIIVPTKTISYLNYTTINITPKFEVTTETIIGYNKDKKGYVLCNIKYFIISLSIFNNILDFRRTDNK